MKKSLFLSFCFLAGFCSFSNAVFAQEVSQMLRYEPGFTVVNGRINGRSKNYRIMIDTAATWTAVDWKLANDLKLPILKDIKAITPTGEVIAASSVEMKSISFGGVTVYDQAPLAVDLSHLPELSGGRVDMIVGFDVLKHLNRILRINYQSRQVSFEKEPAKNWASVPIVVIEDFPAVKVKVSGKNLVLALATSGRGSVFFFPSEHFGVSTKQADILYSLAGQVGALAEKAFLDLETGNTVLKGQLVYFVKEHPRDFMDVDGILGGLVLKGLEVDFEAMEFRFKQ